MELREQEVYAEHIAENFIPGAFIQPSSKWKGRLLFFLFDRQELRRGEAKALLNRFRDLLRDKTRHLFKSQVDKLCGLPMYRSKDKIEFTQCMQQLSQRYCASWTEQAAVMAVIWSSFTRTIGPM